MDLAGEHFTADVGAAVASQRAPIDGILLTIHPLPATAILRYYPERTREANLTLCTPEPGERSRCLDEEVPQMEKFRRRKAARYLTTPAPGRVRVNLERALQSPLRTDWPTTAPTCRCLLLDAWRRGIPGKQPSHA